MRTASTVELVQNTGYFWSVTLATFDATVVQNSLGMNSMDYWLAGISRERLRHDPFSSPPEILSYRSGDGIVLEKTFALEITSACRGAQKARRRGNYVVSWQLPWVSTRWHFRLQWWRPDWSTSLLFSFCRFDRQDEVLCLRPYSSPRMSAPLWTRASFESSPSSALGMMVTTSVWISPQWCGEPPLSREGYQNAPKITQLETFQGCVGFMEGKTLLM